MGRRLEKALHLQRIELILADLHAADTIGHMRRPGYRLHELRGRRSGLIAGVFLRAIEEAGAAKALEKLSLFVVWD